MAHQHRRLDDAGLAEPGIEIERIGETKVRDKACYEVTIRRFGRPTYRLFFDKQSHLLAKVDFTGPCYDKNGKALPGTMLVEFFFSDYQTVDGIKQWKRQEQWRDGQPYTEMDVLEIRVLAEADDALFRGPITEKALIKARLDERKDRIRRTLADLGPDGGSDFSRLVAGLKHKQSRPRALARKGLQQYIELWRDKLTDPMVREDVAALAALLEREEDPTLQGFAIEAVSALGPAAAEAAPALVSVIRDNRETKLIPSAMRALRRIGVKTDDTLQAFENNLEHPDAAVREDAILAVLQLWPDRLPLAQLVELANQPGTAELVRSSAEQAIRQKLSTATAKDLPALRQGLKNSNRVIRLSFIDAIANLKEAGREAAPDLVPLVASVDNQVATQALKAIESIGQLMTVANESTDPVVLTAILRALSIKGGKTDPVLAIFEKHQDHANNDVRNICVIALLDLAPDRVTLNRLADLMLLPNPEIRVPAERMMKQKLTAVTVKDVPALRIGLKNPNKDIRMSFLDALGTLKDDGADAAAEVAGLLESSDADTVTKAAKVLEGLGKAGTKAVPVLEKLLDSQEKGVSLNAVLALSKVDPDSDAFKTKGIAILLDGLNPDVKELKGFLARPVNAKSAAVLFEIGEPAVAPLFKHLILRNNPKTVVGDMQLQATASRYVGYEMLKEFAKHAKAKDDKKTMQALKKYDTTLKAFWSPEESRLADQAKKLMGIQADTKQLYLNTASASYQAYLAIHALP
ncbi:MAG: hypothetical protein HY289_04410 [Planctomycetes bacterium]|nr:hypothetical protein [Planctomycetota bacterium]